MNFSNFIPARPRRYRMRNRVAAASPGVLNLLSVSLSGTSPTQAELKLQFDTTAEDPIADPAGANPAKWTARIEGHTFVGTSLELGGDDLISLLMTKTGDLAGTDVISYAANPSDIVDADGRQLAAFVDRAIEA